MKASLSIPEPATANKDRVSILHAALAVLWDISPNPPITKPAGPQLTTFNKEKTNQNRWQCEAKQ